MSSDETNAEDTIEQFSRGTRFRVEPERIERALASLWQAAARTKDHQHSVTRACLWNLIIHLEEREGREGHAGSDALNAMIPHLPRFIASRTLIVRTKDGAQPNEEDLETFISANCVLGPDGKKQVCSEEITILARDLGDRHVPALVRALVVPSIPSALVVAGLPPEEEPMIAGLLHTLDRVVVNLDESESPSPLGRAMTLMDGLPAGLTDLGWIQDAPLRRAVASLFDGQAIGRRLASLRKIRFSALPDRPRSAHLFLGWIAGCLSTRPTTRLGIHRWAIEATKADNALIELILDDEGRLGVEEIEFVDADGLRLGIITRCEGSVSVTANADGDAVQRTQVVPSKARDISTALSSRDEDDFLRRALFVARGM
ncbi:MAG: glucose-6-phosphate dehydrogenase assembly protein OpcA [Deltaproteobacteria bacterium]|nr:glucose-6-phosphate dehydrogenase assembly protein OpcA [Deltaproteobacteria bacterium]